MFPNLPAFSCKSCKFLGIVLLSCLGLAGCASWGTQAVQADPDPDTQMGARLRKPGPPGQMVGIDDRAREIERNLGVR